ncbi:MAG TPA: error-prone DNA polymerase [Xanthobacteraceae bacterium]|jgi:error-prone DNA polymerase|nr:error-prone DNA polymerase [Xanthobacteraceae bacterium]
MSAYAELAVTTNFSFLRGASHPQEMVAQADTLGLAAIGIADRNSFAGAVRAYDEAQKRNIKLLVGTRLVTVDGFEVLTYPSDRAAYGRLCRLITAGNLQAKKGECSLSFAQILSAGAGQIFIALPPLSLSARPRESGDPVLDSRLRGNERDNDFTTRLAALAEAAPGRTFLAGAHYHRGDEPRRLGLLAEAAARFAAPLVAVNDVHYHAPGRRPLADVLTCVREKCTLADAGLRLSVNAERHIKPPTEMARLFANFPGAIARSVEIAEACRFSLGELKYEYPDEPVPQGKTAQQHLEDLTWAGARERYSLDRYPEGIPADVQKRLHDELQLIAKLDYARYFLTVYDVVAFARNRDKEILCQGRGSAANSAVCFCLGITSVNPDKSNLLFARFISENRGEPPDIDVDFEHERREEVIQHIYARYGRHRAAICATVVHYRSRRAIREVGKVLGLTEDITAALAKTVWGYGDGLPDDHIRQAGLDPQNPALRQAVELAEEMIGFPRHLSQHVGGFVLTRERLDETVPIGNAAMADRTFIEWDKDDIDTLGLMKVDVLALGMLSCLRRGLDLLQAHYGKDYSLATLPADDRAVYDMLSRADSVGVFQVESRAQMSMLPRLKPQCFYDLVIEVAIVRPGPIQGDMVHPYLRRRDGIERERYPSPHPAHGPADELKDVLKRTLGVPLFQEQAMQIAITAAKFTPDEADGLRRAMATFRHTGNVHLFRDKFINGMVARGYERDFAEHCFGQIEGFGEYGFPESHAASFALLVYASAWIKCRYPDVFAAAILNSQPMGFYQPAQLVRDARMHGVEIREADVNFSDWDCTLEPSSLDRHSGAERSGESGMTCAVRLGFRLVAGLAQTEIAKLMAVRGNGFSSIERLAAIAGVSRLTIERLAEADAFRSLGLDRRAALWAARRLDMIGIRPPRAGAAAAPPPTLPLLAPHQSDELFAEPPVALPAMPLCEQVVEDYVATGLSLKAHPVRFFRDRLVALGAIRNAALRGEDLTQDATVTVAGLVLVRQRPGTSKGVVFMTLEDETDIANIIVWPKVFAQNRRTVMTARFLAVRGTLQRAGLVIHVIAASFFDLSAELPSLRDGELSLPAPSCPSHQEGSWRMLKSRDFH